MRGYRQFIAKQLCSRLEGNIARTRNKNQNANSLIQNVEVELFKITSEENYKEK